MRLGVSAPESSGRLHPVGKPCPWPAQEPRWCRLLPTAWLSGFPSGLTSFSTPTFFVPRESGRPLAKLSFNPEVPQASPNPFLTHLRARLPQETARGEPPAAQDTPDPGSLQTPSSLLELLTRLHSPYNNRALGMGCCFCSWAGVEQHGKASLVLAV